MLEGCQLLAWESIYCQFLSELRVSRWIPTNLSSLRSDSLNSWDFFRRLADYGSVSEGPKILMLSQSRAIFMPYSYTGRTALGRNYLCLFVPNDPELPSPDFCHQRRVHAGLFFA